MPGTHLQRSMTRHGSVDVKWADYVGAGRAGILVPCSSRLFISTLDAPLKTFGHDVPQIKVEFAIKEE